MAKRPKYKLSFAPQAIKHLDLIDAKHHTLLRRAMNEQLTYAPLEETRNRNRLLIGGAEYES